MSERLVLYPGSFDPMTLGHQNIVERALVHFDVVLVAVLDNPAKSGLFAPPERAALIREVFRGNDRVRVEVFDGLLVDFARARSAQAVIRGLRAVQDFEYEFQMAMMNRRLAPELETLFMMTDAEHFYVASRLVKEVARFGGDFESLVPDPVARAMSDKLTGEG